MRFLHGAEDGDFVEVNIVMWIGDTEDGWEPWVRCLDVPVIGLVSGWPIGVTCWMVTGLILPGPSKRGLVFGEYLYFLPDSGCHLRLGRRHYSGICS